MFPATHTCGRDNCGELILPLDLVGPGDPTQAVSPGGKRLYLLNLPSGLRGEASIYI